jgi:hypothetical protein
MCNNIAPLLTYSNMEANKWIVLYENKDKSGIYRINNMITNKSYIGSSIDISKRFKNYYKSSYINSKRNNSIIYSALLKYNYINFSVDILEYCKSDSLIIREQYYLDFLKPEYNILKIAGNRLGSKHSKEAKANMSVNHVASSPLRKTNHLLATGHRITVINKENNTARLFDSIRAAASNLGTSHNLLLTYINNNKLYKGIYKIIRNT